MPSRGCHAMKTEDISVIKGRNPSSRHLLIKWIQAIDSRFEEVFIAAGFISFIIIICLQVLNRYLLPFVEIANITTWTEELARYIFIWISYLGASLAIKKRDTIQVDALTRLLPQTLKKALDLATTLFMLYFSYTIISGGLSTTFMQIDTSQISPAMQIPMSIAYLAVPCGFLAMAVRMIQNLIADVKGMNTKEIAFGLLIAFVLSLPVVFLTDGNAAAILFAYFALFIVIGMPIAFALGVSTLATTIATDAIPLDYFSQTAFTSIDNFPIMAIPFFVAAGIIMSGGGLINRLLRFSNELVGFLPGGLAMVTVVTCMFFAAISGSGPATVAAIGTIMIPAMIKQGYNPGFAAAIVAAAGSIGVIIPPSNPFVIYGVVAQQSISKLFISGIIPGILVGVGLMLVTYFISKKNGWRGDKTSFHVKSIVSSAWDAKLALIVPILILGGIYGGIMTPTEAAAIAAAYGLVISLWVYRDLNAKSLYASLVQAGLTSSVIILLIAMATIFGRLMAIERVAETVAQFVLSISENKIVVLLLINVLLLIVGVFMEALAAIVILTPILLPMIVKLGIDPIHFGVIMVLNLAIGFITPPVGVNLFVASGISKLRIEEIVRRIFPLLAIMLIILLIITFIPNISLWLIHNL